MVVKISQKTYLDRLFLYWFIGLQVFSVLLYDVVSALRDLYGLSCVFYHVFYTPCTVRQCDKNGSNFTQGLDTSYIC